MTTDFGKPLFSLTVGEFIQLQNSHITPILSPATKNINGDKYAYGYEGGMKLFHCSKPTFYRILKSGKISPAIKQIGRKIIIDTELALELAGQRNGGRK